ncbi:alanine:cation symporter family protein [Leucobacter coleopterorum]|uniref:Alanine:cation symporter family protein n=1 Tax=Leucobacter coleopterorum TaxID=2714933 RepID=A0ABX6JVA9_9MICO|nr:alanine/glycine:cation symporter family protein [Leucobacter coleopterorum]QIM18197.1 alanine:cation symporter family protein [Leucobacter coleopterorum]
MDELLRVIGSINTAIWNPMAYLALGLGLFYTVWTGAVQVRHLPSLVKVLREESKGEGEISSFQALMLTLSSRVGVGNIAGVATAIAAGGPGALFWMVVMALFGGATAFAESTLAQIYKRRVGGEYRGGIPYYIEKGLGQKWLAVVAAVATLVLYSALAPGVQSFNIANSMGVGFGLPGWVSGLVVTALFALVVLGGTKRIAAVADKVVPIMAIGYLLMALVIIIINIAEVPAVFALVFSSAFGVHQVFGGIVGAAIAWGVRRAVFSNVAGVGEGTYASAAAAVSHPAKQGIVQAFSVYVDTVLVCSATGIMILMTGSYNVITEAGKTLVENLPGVSAGTAYTQSAIETILPGFGPGFVAVALFLFAFTTLIAFNYIASSATAYLFSERSLPLATRVMQIVMLAMVFFGAVAPADLIWGLGDIGYGTLGWVNMICLIFLAGIVRKTLKDYDRQRRAGLDPVFDPIKLGIRGTEVWNTATPTNSVRIAMLYNEELERSRS